MSETKNNAADCTLEPPRKKQHLDNLSESSNGASAPQPKQGTPVKTDCIIVDVGSTPPSKQEYSLNQSKIIPNSSNGSLDAAEKRKSEGNDGAQTATAADFSQLEIVRVLSNSDVNCSIAVEAKHATADGRVLVRMQKCPFAEDEMDSIVAAGTSLRQLLHNDVYSKHMATLPPHLNEVSVTVVHPATDKHFQRYERDACSIVEETPHLYNTVTRPYVESGAQLGKQWIYNILDGLSEADRVIHRDPDPCTGFVLFPDLKWTGLQLKDLYCQAIVVRRDLSSLRELTGAHLPLLRNVRDKGMTAIESQYGVRRERVRVYVHYLPSFYHFHVHFTALTSDAHGTWCGKAHLLGDIISNLEICPEYYSKATLSFIVKDNHPHPLALGNSSKKGSSDDTSTLSQQQTHTENSNSDNSCKKQ